MEQTSIPNDRLNTVADFFYYNRLYLKSFGIYTIISDGRLSFDYNTIIFYISSINLIVAIIGEVAYLVAGIMSGELEIFQITYLLLCIGFCLISAAKMLLLIIHLNEIVKFFYEAGLQHPTTFLEQKNFASDEFLKRSNFLVYWYALMNYFMICCFTFFPLYAILSYYYVTGEWMIELPYNILYPFDHSSNGIFFILYVMQVWAALSSSVGIICVDTMLCVMVQVICMHFRVIDQSILYYQPKLKQNIEEKRMFIHLIKKHNLIFE